MSVLTVNINDLDRVFKDKEHIGRAIDRATSMVYIRARQLVPVDTGILKMSIEAKRKAYNIGVVYTNSIYGPYVEYGTGLFAYDGKGRASTDEHPIPWKYKDAEGRWHTTKGQKAQPFMRRALNECQYDILQAFKYSLQEDLTK